MLGPLRTDALRLLFPRGHWIGKDGNAGFEGQLVSTPVYGLILERWYPVLTRLWTPSRPLVSSLVLTHFLGAFGPSCFFFFVERTRMTSGQRRKGVAAISSAS
jgi:hypothetical protein